MTVVFVSRAAEVCPRQLRVFQSRFAVDVRVAIWGRRVRSRVRWEVWVLHSLVKLRPLRGASLDLGVPFQLQVSCKVVHETTKGACMSRHRQHTTSHYVGTLAMATGRVHYRFEVHSSATAE